MNPLAMTLLLGAGLGLFAWTAVRRLRLMRVARAPAQCADRPGQRWAGVLRYIFGQSRMFRYRGAGIAHACIFAGFVVLLLRALVLFARGYVARPDFGFWIFDDHMPAGAVYLFLKDLIEVLVVAGVAYFLYVRLGPRPARMEHSREGLFILLMILGVVISDLTYEAAGYVLASRNESDAGVFHAVTPAASVLALLLQPLSSGAAQVTWQVAFWAHATIVLLFLNLLPYGKHFHVLTVLPNVYFRSLTPISRLEPINDMEGRIERGETLGVRSVRDLSWKDVLDLYTCTECGRCSDHCPATNTGKLLSPKHLTMTLRDYMYGKAAALLAGGEASSDSSDDGGATTPLVPGVIEPEILWACTTCGACEQECPVFISYVDKIIGMRRHLVMEQGEFPDQLQNAFRGLETVGNPYSFPNEQRAAWAEGLDVPLLRDCPDAEYLYWVGCGPSFDDRSRRIVRAFARLLNEAGVRFAILGPEERCTGDPARRAGNEYLFDAFARQNVETLNNYGVRRIVTTCPHCYQTLRNEYSDFGGRYEVLHHSELLLQLLRSGRLQPKHEVRARVVYHDSCYIGRYNGIYDPPREILRAIPGLRLVEAGQARDRGMCCGAGGAQMWKEDEPIRRPNSREGDGKVNHARTRQLLRVLPTAAGMDRGVATACPFCKTMISDGLIDQGHTDVTQLDVAEYLLRSVIGEPCPPAAAPPVAATPTRSRIMQ